MLSVKPVLTLKAKITTAADDNLLLLFLFSEKISLDISCESSAAKQTIHMKCQDLFSLKKKLECHLLQIFSWRFKG